MPRELIYANHTDFRSQPRAGPRLYSSRPEPGSPGRCAGTQPRDGHGTGCAGSRGDRRGCAGSGCGAAGMCSGGARCTSRLYPRQLPSSRAGGLSGQPPCNRCHGAGRPETAAAGHLPRLWRQLAVSAGAGTRRLRSRGTSQESGGELAADQRPRMDHSAPGGPAGWRRHRPRRAESGQGGTRTGAPRRCGRPRAAPAGG